MKKAFVNCRIMPGGVLNVFQDMIRNSEFSDAKIFTLFSDRKELVVGDVKLQIITALPKWLNNLFLFFSIHHIKFLSSLFDYRNLMVVYPFCMKMLSRKIKKYNPEFIEISSFAIAKNISVYDIPKSLYLHSPMQYIWSHYNEYQKKLSGFKLWLFKFITPRLRKWDKKYVKFDEIKFNSYYTAKLAKELYGMEGRVAYPKIDECFQHCIVNKNPSNYCVYVGRTVKFVKEVDKIIKLFNEVDQPLLIVGSGPDEEYLKSIAGNNIIFVGWISDPEEKMKIISNSKGLINITKESFGICTMEALLCGVPVFGFNDGASVELVNKDCGILVSDKDVNAMIPYLNEFLETDWDRENIQNKAKNIEKQ